MALHFFFALDRAGAHGILCFLPGVTNDHDFLYITLNNFSNNTKKAIAAMIVNIIANVSFAFFVIFPNPSF
jgi:hypothetical protein